MTTDRPRTSRASVARGLLVAAALLGASLALKRLAPAHPNPDAARRILGVLLGAVVIGFANAVPKALPPLLGTRCEPAAEQAMRRYTGWSLTLGGAGYAAAWAIAPLAYANVLAATLLGTALLLVVFRLTRVTSARPRS
jgi:hypothetical protein